MSLKIVHCMNMTAHGNLSPKDLQAGGRGVTGSEQAMIYLAQMQAKMGHKVYCYYPTATPGNYDGVEVMNFDPAYPRFRRADGADVAISWLSADFLRNFPEKTLKIHSLQINDWMLNAAGSAEYADVRVAVSEAHRRHLLTQDACPGEDKWEVIPNGVDTGRFTGSAIRSRNRCVYLSSPDRGLHWALAIWPEIRFAFPDAELHIYYEVQKWLENAVLLNNDLRRRAVYVTQRLQGGERHGIFVHGAVPPHELSRELLAADVMLYPCDPVRFTEGFGVAVLDACAAGVVPVLSDADALGEIYERSGAVVVPRLFGSQWTDRYLEAALDLLGNPEGRDIRRKKVQEFAYTYDWSAVSKLWMDMIEKHLQARASCGEC